jgi:hypothetical protein
VTACPNAHDFRLHADYELTLTSSASTSDLHVQIAATLACNCSHLEFIPQRSWVARRTCAAIASWSLEALDAPLVSRTKWTTSAGMDEAPSPIVCFAAGQPSVFPLFDSRRLRRLEPAKGTSAEAASGFTARTPRSGGPFRFRLRTDALRSFGRQRCHCCARALAPLAPPPQTLLASPLLQQPNAGLPARGFELPFFPLWRNAPLRPGGSDGGRTSTLLVVRRPASSPRARWRHRGGRKTEIFSGKWLCV